MSPPGWRFNPSAWRERRFVVSAALVGLGIAIYLTLYQVGVVGHAWDPFFGARSSARVLHSPVARSLPFPDAALGAFAYLVEAVTATAGDDDRWHTRPWLVLIYAATAIGLGAASTVFVILQPLVARAWCTLCLVSAAISVSLVGPAFAEARAALGR